MQVHHHSRANSIHPVETGPLRMGDLTIDLDGYLITYPDGTMDILTLRERDLLRVFIREYGRTLSYADLGLYAWHYPDRYYSMQGIRNCIWHLRRKLRDAATIETVRNIGYRFCRTRPSR